MMRFNFTKFIKMINGCKLKPRIKYGAGFAVTIILLTTIPLITNHSLLHSAVSTYTFTTGGGTDKWVYISTTSSLPPAQGPDISWQQSVTNYTDIATSDNVYYSTVTGNSSTMFVLNHKFTINEDTNTITQLDLEFEGKNTAFSSSGVQLRIWNFSTSQWVALADYNGTAEVVLSSTIVSGCTNYIDANKNLYIFGATKGTALDLANPTTFYADFVKVLVTAGPTAPTAITSLSALSGDFVGAVKLTWTYPETLSAGSSYYIQYSTNANTSWNYNNANIIVSTIVAAGVNQQYNVGGLGIGRGSSNEITSPNYYFRVWITTGPSAFSNISNATTNYANTPSAGTDTGPTAQSDGGWLTTFNDASNLGDGGQAVAKDNSGNVYIAGNYSNGSNNDIIVRKYNSVGTVQWTRYYNSPNNFSDGGYGVAVDGSGNVYVTGYETRDDIGQGANIWVRKYDTNGNVLWTDTYNNPNNNQDWGRGVAVDSSGNVYVTGSEYRSAPSQDYNIWIRKYDTNGLIQWTTTYNSPNNAGDEGFGIAADGSDNVYVTGYENRADIGQGNNIWVRKYDTNGNVLWTDTYNDPGNSNDWGYGVAVDGSGNVYVTGSETRADISQSLNIWVRKYNTNGTALWTETYTSPGSASDYGKGIAVDGSGNIYVTGYEDRTDLGQADNIWVRKYDTNGLIQWTTTYNSPDNGFDYGYGIEVDASGNVYVTGSEYRADLGQSYNIWTRKYRQDYLTQPVITTIQKTTDTVTFNWTDSNYESSYTVKTADGFNKSGTLAANTINFIISGLSPNVSTSVYITAYNSWASSSSAIVSTYTLANPPITLSFNGVYGSSITFSWNVNNNPNWTRFGVSRSTNTEFTGPSVSTFVAFGNNLTANTTTAFGLNADTTYYIRVWAYNEDQIQTASIQLSTKTLSTGDTTPPSQVTGFTAVTGAQVQLSWTAPGDDNYTGNVTGGQWQIKYSSTVAIGETGGPGQAEWTIVKSSSFIQGATTYAEIITGLKPRTTYYFWIRARDENDANWSVWSDTASAVSSAFIESWNAGISEQTYSITAGDFDNDGDYDLAVANVLQEKRIYRNDNGTYNSHWTSGESDNYGYTTKWFDYDNDGDLDVIFNRRIYRNDNGNFVYVTTLSPDDSANTYSIDTGDYDNDGDVDILIGKYSNSSNQLYRNDSGIFNLVFTSTEALNTHHITWGDYDNDGDLDQLTADYGTPNKIYKNDNGNFVVSWQSDESNNANSIVWGDFDNDGDLDFVSANYNQPIRFYKNNGGVFTNNWTSSESSTHQWLTTGDMDNNGWLDIVVICANNPLKIYYNNNGVFSLNFTCPKSYNSRSILSVDMDNDGDLDIIIGNWNEPNCIYKSLEADFGNSNTLPSAPSSGFSSYYDGQASLPLQLRWSDGSDTEIGANAKGLYYNIRVATESITGVGENNIKKWTVSTSTGAGVANFGNYPHGFAVASSTQPGLNLSTNTVTEGVTYYWQVQTIDPGLRKSAWSVMQSTFVIFPDNTAPAAITELSAVPGSNEGEINLSWSAPGDNGWNDALAGGSKFKVQRSTASDGTGDYKTGWSTGNAQIEVSTSGVTPNTLVSHTVTGLTANSTYYFRIWHADESANYSDISNAAVKCTLANPPVDSQVVSVSSATVSISWSANGNPAGTRYGIVRSTDNFITSTTTVKTAGDNWTATVYTDADAGLKPAATYYYKINSFNGDGIATAFGLAMTTVTLPAPQDTIPPSIVDNQSGDNTMRNTDPGAIYNVDFEDAGGLDTLQYFVSTQPAQGGETVINWTNITVLGGATYYNPNWGVNFAALAELPTTNYLSVRAWDVAGNTTTVQDIFYILKDVTVPNSAISVPQNNGKYNALPAISGNSNDNYQISSVKVRIRDLTTMNYWNGFSWEVSPVWNTASGTTNWTLSLSSWTSGKEYSVISMAQDPAGNLQINYASATFKYDTGLPISQITYPVSGDYNSLQVFSGTASDDYSGLQKVQIRLKNNTDNQYWNGGVWQGSETWIYATGLESWNYDFSSSTSWVKGKQYTLNSRAVDNASNLQNQISSVTFTYDARPAAPAWFGAINRTATSIEWGWTDSSDNEDGFRIKTDTGGIVGTVSLNTTYYLEAGLSANTSYYRYVEAYNVAGSSAASVLISLTLANPPTGSYIAAVSSFSVNLIWSGNGNPAGTRYGIIRSTDNFITSTTTIKTAGHNWTVTTYLDNDAGIKPATTYYYKINSFNGDGIASAYGLAMTTVTLPAPEVVLSISLSTNTYSFGMLTVSSSAVSVSPIVITNDGNVVQRYRIKCSSSTPDNWAPVSAAPSTNEFRILSLFNSVSVNAGSFDTGADYLAPADTDRMSSGTVFYGDYSGDNVAVSGTRNLWLRLDTPVVSGTGNQQAVVITITAEGQP